MGVTVILVVNGTLNTVPQNMEKGARRDGNQKNQDHPNNNIVSSSQNTEKNPSNLKFSDTHTSFQLLN